MTYDEALASLIADGIELGAGDYIPMETLKVCKEALEKQSKIVHCKDCQNWKAISTETLYGTTIEVGQCELAKWLCGGQGYCMYGRREA